MNTHKLAQILTYCLANNTTGSSDILEFPRSKFHDLLPPDRIKRSTGHMTQSKMEPALERSAPSVTSSKGSGDVDLIRGFNDADILDFVEELEMLAAGHSALTRPSLDPQAEKAPSYKSERHGSAVSAASKNCISMPPSGSDTTDIETDPVACCSIADGSVGGFICSAHFKLLRSHLQHDLPHLEHDSAHTMALIRSTSAISTMPTTTSVPLASLLPSRSQSMGSHGQQPFSFASSHTADSQPSSPSRMKRKRTRPEMGDSLIDSSIMHSSFPVCLI